jgi:predicted esterase YcpF (UPF0227 family)
VSRANDCVETIHQHVNQCMRAGYANGREDAFDEVEAAIQRLVDDIEGVMGVSTGGYRTGLTTAVDKVKAARG